jgi:centromere protein C
MIADIDVDIAFSANSFVSKAAHGAEFTYAKLHSKPFFGTGVVDVPAGGYKRSKNSRRMEMVFFVHTGKVDVTVGEIEFTISKGGIWHVPRGTFHSIFSLLCCLIHYYSPCQPFRTAIRAPSRVTVAGLAV